MPTFEELLFPGGLPIGAHGIGRLVRKVSGGASATKELFDALTVGGTRRTPLGYPGVGYDLPKQGWVGLRIVSKSGEPTIDIDVPKIRIRKIKFVEDRA